MCCRSRSLGCFLWRSARSCAACTRTTASRSNSVRASTSTPFESVPYFWSDQYDAKLQSLGTAKAQDEMQVVWGSLDEPKWVALLHDGDQLNGVVGLRAPGRVMKLRGLLAAKASYSEAL